MRKTFQRGLIVGKFCPLHRGHEHAIRAMLDACEHGFILSYTNPEFPGCEPPKRRHWLAALFPEATSLVLDAAAVPPNDADDLTQRRFAAQICRERFKTTVDAVFTSEDYGECFAQELSHQFAHPVHHISVDPTRTTHPVSGTQIRADLHAHYRQLSPVVYTSFVTRVCLLGGESSGKSTLAAALAAHFQTRHVAEYGRELWEMQNGHLNYDDMLQIARTQITRENEAAGASHRFLFCDTSPLTTLLYSHHLFGQAEAELETLANREYDLYVLCAADFRFQQDGTRRDAAFRDKQDTWYRTELTRRSLKWIEAVGNETQRIASVSAALLKP